MGSMNYAKYSKRRKEFVFHTVFENSFETIITFLNAMNELGIKPEHECFDSGPHREPRPAARHGPAARAAPDLVRDGRDRRHPAERAQPRAHVGADPRRRRGPERVGRDRHLPATSGCSGAAALTLGGNFRVGLEDNFYLPDGEMARSNGDLIAKARQMVEDVGRRPATVDRGARDARDEENVVAAEAGGHGGGGLRSPMPGALEGVRVLDLTPAAAGRLLHAAARRHGRRRAEGRGHRRAATTSAGCRPTTAARSSSATGTASAYFLALNRNKRSLQPEPQARARAATCCCAWPRTTTCWSRASGPA